MSNKSTGGSAFPHNGGHKMVMANAVHKTMPDPGMTLRDYFAAKFLCGRAAVPGFVDPQHDAELAYRVADAMLAERDK